MSQSIGRWFQETIIERAKRILWTRFAAEMETEALLDYAAQLKRIEEQAAEYDANGQPQLAEMLRSKAADISPENPIAAAERAAKLLSHEQPQPARLPAPVSEKRPPKNAQKKPVTGSKGRGRPKKVVVKPDAPVEMPSPAIDESAEQ